MTSTTSHWLGGGGDMGERIRTFPWSTSPLGPIEQWPSALTSPLSICLSARFPMAIYWGAEKRLLYNDARRPILGDKHPWAMGRTALLLPITAAGQDEAGTILVI